MSTTFRVAEPTLFRNQAVLDLLRDTWEELAGSRFEFEPIDASTAAPFEDSVWADELDWSAVESDPVDMDRLRTMVGDDPEQIREIVQVYLTESEQLMKELWTAVRSGEAREAERLAHKLGGSSATVGMVGIVAPLMEMELSGKAASKAESERILREASRQQARISSYLSLHVFQA